MIEQSVNAPVPEQDADQKAHEEAMIARVDGKPVDEPEVETPEGTTEEAELILGKFKTQADLEKAYKELESKLGSRPSESEDSSTETTPSTEVELERPSSGDPVEEAQQDLAEAGLDFRKYAESFNENGGLTEDDYAELDKKGFPREMTDIYIEGLQHRIDLRQKAAVTAVGTEEEFVAVREWAGSSLSDAEFEAFNRQLSAAQSSEDVSLLYGTLAQKYRKANPSEPRLVSGDGGAPSGRSGYGSKSELTTAMRDPRYGKDPHYTHEVEEKTKATDWL